MTIYITKSFYIPNSFNIDFECCFVLNMHCSILWIQTLIHEFLSPMLVHEYYSRCPLSSFSHENVVISCLYTNAVTKYTIMPLPHLSISS